MSTQTKRKSSQAKKNKPAASIVWFEIPVDDPKRAQKFYGTLFSWKINPFPQVADYWHIDTGGSEDSLDGGMLPRKHSKQPITNNISVPSVTRFAAKVEKLGGKIMKSKTAVPQMGYFVICRDTENNEFAIWEPNEKAK
jgi:predicted enzyme related to lactoylglutathione lyase